MNEREKEIVNEGEEYLKAESGTCLLQHVGVVVSVERQKSHIQMLLMMGVRDCPEQVEVYSEVLGRVRGGGAWRVRCRISGEVGEGGVRVLLWVFRCGGHLRVLQHVQSVSVRVGSHVGRVVPQDILSGEGRVLDGS